jgi:hypothetical protein
MATKNNSERLGGSFLIGYALFSLVAIAHHPQVSAKLDDATTFARITALSKTDEIMHGIMIALLLLLAFGLIVLARSRGLERSAITGALLCGVVGTAAAAVAGTTDGFWLPWYAGRMAGADPTHLAIGVQLVTAASIMIQVASKIGLVGIATAIVLFSVDFFDDDRNHGLLGGYGVFAGIGVIVLLATFASRLTPHTLLAPMLIQTIWLVIVGALLARGQMRRAMTPATVLGPDTATSKQA